MQKKTKIRVIVLDGLDWEYVNANKEIVAPLWSIAEEGCAALLKACDAPLTPSAVCALLSGRDAGVGWFSDDHYTTSQELIRTRPWFPEVARHDMNVGLCNVPLTWPAFHLPKDSWVVSGFPVDPATLTDRRRPWHWPPFMDVDGYPIEGVVRDNGPGGSTDLDMLMETEHEIVDWFLNKAERADIEFIWLRATDSAGHHAWGTSDYDRTVEHAAKLGERLCEGAENVVVISDHGFAALDSKRCDAYHKTSHGPASVRAGLAGGHSEEGILFAKGDSIFARGILKDQKLDEVASGIFDILQIPPAPGMSPGRPQWSVPYSQDEAVGMLESLSDLGYSLT